MDKRLVALGVIGLGVVAGYYYLQSSGNGGQLLGSGSSGERRVPVLGSMAGTPESEKTPITVYQFPPSGEVKFPQPGIIPVAYGGAPVAERVPTKKEMKTDTTKHFEISSKTYEETYGKTKKTISGTGKPRTYTTITELMGLPGGIGGQPTFESPAPYTSVWEQVQSWGTGEKKTQTKKHIMTKTEWFSKSKEERKEYLREHSKLRKKAEALKKSHKKRHTSGHHHISSSSYAYHYKHHVGKPSSKKTWVAM